MQSKLNHSIILLKALNRLAEKHLFKNEFEEFYEHKLGKKPLSILLPPVPTNTEWDDLPLVKLSLSLFYLSRTNVYNAATVTNRLRIFWPKLLWIVIFLPPQLNKNN